MTPDINVKLRFRLRSSWLFWFWLAAFIELFFDASVYAARAFHKASMLCLNRAYGVEVGR